MKLSIISYFLTGVDEGGVASGFSVLNSLVLSGEGLEVNDSQNNFDATEVAPSLDGNNWRDLDGKDADDTGNSPNLADLQRKFVEILENRDRES
jgi:hypothetical protein